MVVYIGNSLRRVINIPEVAPSPLPTMVPCVPSLRNNRLLIVFSLVLGIELNILCVSAVKGVTQWRRESIPLVQALYRDGLIYFVVLFSTSLINVIFIAKMFDSPYFYLLADLQSVLHSVLTSRLIINLRKAAVVDDVSTIATITSMRFVEGHHSSCKVGGKSDGGMHRSVGGIGPDDNERTVDDDSVGWTANVFASET